MSLGSNAPAVNRMRGAASPLVTSSAKCFSAVQHRPAVVPERGTGGDEGTKGGWFGEQRMHSGQAAGRMAEQGLVAAVDGDQRLDLGLDFFFDYLKERVHIAVILRPDDGFDNRWRAMLGLGRPAEVT